MKKFKIKICGIKSTAILDYCNYCDVDYFGLIFYKNSPRNINIQQASDLINHQNKFKTIPVGVFVNHDLTDIIKLIKKTNLKFIQLHGNENNEYIARLKIEHNITVIKVLRIQGKNDINKVKSYSHADYFLFDYNPKKNELPGGNAKSFNWSILKNVKITKPWFISGGINRDNIKYILENLIPYGIDISSGVEEQLGIKSSNKIKEIVKIIND